MGYLNKTILELDAVLTDRGRELLSKNPQKAVITQFAVADDEVDYDMWNPNNPNGTEFYGTLIENMPVLEATINSNQALKFKLVTLDKDTNRMPVIDVGQTNITLKSGGQLYTISPNTINFEGGNSTLGYTAIISNSDVATIIPSPGYEINTEEDATIITITESTNDSISAKGFKFDITAKTQSFKNASTTITLIGNETGGIVQLQLTVLKETTATMTPIN